MERIKRIRTNIANEMDIIFILIEKHFSFAFIC